MREYPVNNRFGYTFTCEFQKAVYCVLNYNRNSVKRNSHFYCVNSLFNRVQSIFRRNTLTFRCKNTLRCVKVCRTYYVGNLFFEFVCPVSAECRNINYMI